MHGGMVSKGFTLIEVLIVVAVLGILVGIGTFGFNAVLNDTKDGQAEASAQHIADLLERYRRDYNEYPSICVNGDNFGCGASLLESSLVPAYASKMPDSYPNIDNAGVFSYVRGTGGQTYALYLRFNAKEDCKRGTGVVAGWWPGLPIC